jgi:hypothetical protein
VLLPRLQRDEQGRTHRRSFLLAGAVAVAGAGAVAALLKRSVRRGSPAWFAVTVQADPAELEGPDRPDALARLAEHHEVRITRAPGGRGSEIKVRAANGAVREEVRAVKQLLETGEVLVVEGQPEGHRTLTGRVAGPAFRQLTRRGPR